MSIDDYDKRPIERPNPIASFLAGIGVSIFEKMLPYNIHNYNTYYKPILPFLNIIILGLTFIPSCPFFRKEREIMHYGTGEWGSNEKGYVDEGIDFRALGAYILGAGLVYGPEIYRIGKWVADALR